LASYIWTNDYVNVKAFLEAWKSLCEVEAANFTPMLVVPEEKKFLLKPVIFQGPCNSDSVHVQVIKVVIKKQC
jgi:polygalacturonase